jgi:capsular polysaccharide biosynthesis protein
MSNFQLEVAESELKIILEALTEMDVRMENICVSSKDEDEVADIGNDLIELRLLLNRLQENAINKFGKNIINFSRESL